VLTLGLSSHISGLLKRLSSISLVLDLVFGILVCQSHSCAIALFVMRPHGGCASVLCSAQVSVYQSISYVGKDSPSSPGNQQKSDSGTACSQGELSFLHINVVVPVSQSITAPAVYIVMAFRLLLKPVSGVGGGSKHARRDVKSAVTISTRYVWFQGKWFQYPAHVW
jgi:hypothetical protein